MPADHDSDVTIAMVLAAGRGSRLRPLSNTLPKPALPLPGGPVIGWSLRQAVAAGVRRTVVNTWWLAEAMEKAVLSAAPSELQLAFSREKDLMETAGGLALARDRGLLDGKGPILVVNGDGILNLDLDPVLSRHAASGDEVTLALLPHLAPERWSRVFLDGNGFVKTIRSPGLPKTGEVPLLYPGVMLVSRTALAALPSLPCGAASALWEPAMERGRLGGVVVSGHWREVGTPNDYLEAVLALLGDRGVFEPDARIHPDAHVGRAYVGTRVEISKGAVIGDSVISHGVSVGAGAKVIRSVLLGRLQIRPGETVVDDFRSADI
ncbi:MAG: NDP-sugar synthase [Thermoanaerobaculales bacterium]|nr:NDP-sugar synthase [Thermoanaerobaculales bacterium]